MDKIKSVLSTKLILTGIFFVVLITSIIISLFLYAQYRQAKRLLQNPQLLTNEQSKNILQEVGKIMSLPSEEPTIATVTDKDKLNNQPFFKNAENGDKVLIYTTAKKAILYRPSANKIIEVLPITIGTGSAAVAMTEKENNVLSDTAGTESAKVKITITPSPTLKTSVTPTMKLTPKISP